MHILDLLVATGQPVADLAANAARHVLDGVECPSFSLDAGPHPQESGEFPVAVPGKVRGVQDHAVDTELLGELQSLIVEFVQGAKPQFRLSFHRKRKSG